MLLRVQNTPSPKYISAISSFFPENHPGKKLIVFMLIFGEGLIAYDRFSGKDKHDSCYRGPLCNQNVPTYP